MPTWLLVQETEHADLLLRNVGELGALMKFAVETEQPKWEVRWVQEPYSHEGDWWWGTNEGTTTTYSYLLLPSEQPVSTEGHVLLRHSGGDWWVLGSGPDVEQLRQKAQDFENGNEEPEQLTWPLDLSGQETNEADTEWDNYLILTWGVPFVPSGEI